MFIGGGDDDTGGGDDGIGGRDDGTDGENKGIGRGDDGIGCDDDGIIGSGDGILVATPMETCACIFFVDSCIGFSTVEVSLDQRCIVLSIKNSIEA